MTIEQIRRALADRRLIVVAKSTGISYGTLLTIRDNPEANPSLKSMLLLEEYLSRGIK